MLALLRDDRGVEFGDVRLGIFLEIALAHLAAELNQSVVVHIVDRLHSLASLIGAAELFTRDDASGCWVERELRINDLLIEFGKRGFEILLKLRHAHLAAELYFAPVIQLDNRIAHPPEFFA